MTGVNLKKKIGHPLQKPAKPFSMYTVCIQCNKDLFEFMYLDMMKSAGAERILAPNEADILAKMCNWNPSFARPRDINIVFTPS
jgi:hypothetical protein